MIKAWDKTYKERQKEIDLSELKFGIIRSKRILIEDMLYDYEYYWYCNCGNVDSGKINSNHKCSKCGNDNFHIEGSVLSHYVLHKSSILNVGITNYRYTAKINADKKCVLNNRKLNTDESEFLGKFMDNVKMMEKEQLTKPLVLCG